MKNCTLAHLAGISFKRMRLHRLLLFFMFMSGLAYSIPAHAEEDVLDKKITLVVKQKPVRDVLNDISQLVEIKFVYSSQKIPARK
jgi:type II secretory pathway component GspD/PulD (secretin)